MRGWQGTRVALACALLGIAACEATPLETSSRLATVACELRCTGVSVTPDDQFVAVPSNASGHQLEFLVRNTSLASHTYTLSCSATGTVTCTGLNQTSVTLAPDQQTAVVASFDTGAPGAGTLALTASGGWTDSGSYKVRAQ